MSSFFKKDAIFELKMEVRTNHTYFRTLTKNILEANKDGRHRFVTQWRNFRKSAKHVNAQIQKLLEKCHELLTYKEIALCWIPSHIGIKGNEMVDKQAKTSL